MTVYQSTDEFLAVKLPKLRKSWLQRINSKIERLLSDPDYGGVELCTRFDKSGEPQWNNWSERDIISRSVPRKAPQ